MTNLDARMGQLRDEMEERYLRGDKEGALEVSLRLDRLIALAQREKGAGEHMVNTGAEKDKQQHSQHPALK